MTSPATSWLHREAPELPEASRAGTGEAHENSASLGLRAYRHAARLAEEIGPRPAGSPAEAQAREYISQTLSNWGYQIEKTPVPFAPIPHFSPLYALAGLALAAGGLGIGQWPWFGLLLPGLFFALPQLTRWVSLRRRRAGASENITVRLPNRREASTTLVLCAHTDSARAGGIHSPFWRRLYTRSLDLAQRAAVGLAAVGLLDLIGLPIPQILEAAAALAGLLAGGWLTAAETWNQLGGREDYSPGANDNASGVGVLLALAEAWAGFIQGPAPHDLALEFLFTTAEETGLHGAEARAAAMQAQPGEGSGLLVLCLDMVGAGNELRYAARDGTIIQRQTSKRLNDLVLKADPGARPLWYIEKSGDFLPFLRHGIPATGLQMTGAPEQELVYHSRLDRVEHLEQAALEHTARTVWEIIRHLAGTGQP